MPSAVCSACGRDLSAPSTGESGWFYVQQRQKVGPVSWQRLKHLVATGALRPADMVLQQGASKWTPVSSLEELFAFTSTVKDLAELQAEAEALNQVGSAPQSPLPEATVHDPANDASAEPPMAEIVDETIVQQPEPPVRNGTAAQPAQPAEDWFYSRNRQKLGPVSWMQLQALAASGGLQPTDMVIRQGSPKWAAASSLEGLFVPPMTVNNTVAQTVDPRGANQQVTVALPGEQRPSQVPQAATIADTVNAPSGQGSAEFVDTLAQAVKAKEANAALPVVPGFEILSVLGRGGMGVVYQARQLSLKRLVALKMVLSAEHAGAQQLARFRSEAEAVAKLQHPNIVQIHEVNEQGGRPFFSLEFVDGGSLANRLAEKPFEPLEAARLIETLARAMHYCHQRGVIHRDLKPANVLLTTDGVPKITDFGLAKQLETDSGQTHSGAVMGTPSYMSPEQASGRTKEIGPLSDVYALGAILYELLTGRPPFRGNSLVETLEQVRSLDAAPPSRIQSKVPRDLETICLKALAKEPARRYASALALCQDLERFQAGEPILGRRESLAGKLYRKARRSPVAAGSLVLVLLAAVAVAHFAFRASATSRLSDLNRSFATQLLSLEPTAESLDGVEKSVGDIARLSPEQAASARERLHQRFAESIHAAIQNAPVLRDDDVQRLGAALDLLASRDPAQEKNLRKELADRASKLQLALDVKDPKRNDKSLVPGNNHVVFTQVACQGTVHLEAEFTAWDNATQVALILNARGNTGYTFQVSAGDSATPTTFAEARKKGQFLHVQLLRNSVRLRERDIKAVELGTGVLRLSAKRAGDRLTFQVNEQPPLEFQDLFPLSGQPGVFGVRWPEGVRLQRLQGWSQAMPAVPSPLERGDDDYAAGRFREALREYQTQAGSTSSSEIKQEARYKEALCLIGLKNDRDASELLKEVAGQAGGAGASRWPILADCQLWLLLLRQNRMTEADALIDKLSAGYGLGVEQLAALLPEDARFQILQRYETGGAAYFLRRPEEIVRNYERALKVRKILEGNAYRYTWAQSGLIKALHLAGQEQRALQMAQDLFKTVGYETIAGESYFWMLRSRREFTRALADVQRFLGQTRDVGVIHYLLLERARTHIAMQRWDDAEADLAEFFKQGTPYYHPLSCACVMQGFLRERRGDVSGARESWKRGLLKYYVLQPKERDADALGPSVNAVHNLMMASLSDDFTEADIEKNMAWISKFTSGDSSYGKLVAVGLPSPAEIRETFQDMWRTPRGRDWARRLAFRDCTLAEYLRVPAFLLLAEFVHKQAFPAALSSEQDELIWKGVNDGYAALQAGKLRDAQALALAFAWKGTPNIPGFTWQTQAKSLDPALRGPIDYIVGRRYLDVLKKAPEDALPFFQSALAAAPADSTLRRLAQADIDRIKK